MGAWFNRWASGENFGYKVLEEPACHSVKDPEPFNEMSQLIFGARIALKWADMGAKGLLRGLKNTQ